MINVKYGNLEAKTRQWYVCLGVCVQWCSSQQKEHCCILCHAYSFSQINVLTEANDWLLDLTSKVFKYNLNRSITHPKVDPTGVRTHNLLIMTVVSETSVAFQGKIHLWHCL